MTAFQEAATVTPATATTASKLTNDEKLRELVYFATLAASSHNTQCWKFQCSPADLSITVFPDLTRACPAVDPDNHHLFASLGCAVENLTIAANHYGYAADIDASRPENGIRIKLSASSHQVDQKIELLFDAIPKRQVTRSEYDGQPLQQDELAEAATGNGVRVELVTDPDKIKTITDFVVRANSSQLNNPDFLNELRTWIRFNEREATAKGDGLKMIDG